MFFEIGIFLFFFCSSCLADFTTAGSECAVCKTKYAQSGNYASLFPLCVFVNACLLIGW